MRTAWIACVIVLACAIGADSSTEQPTWTKDVAPIIHERCSHCHTKDGHGPFALETYRDVTRRAELVRQELLKRTMPPGIARTDYGDFTYAHELTDDQLVMLQDWFRNGTPLGGPEPALPAQRPLEPADLLLKPVVEPDTPHEGNPVWCAVVIDPQNDKPLKVSGFDIVPESPQLVRHVTLAIAAPGLKKTHWTTNGTLDADASRFLGTWAPGYKPWRLPKGVSMTVAPGEKLIAQILVVPAGRPMSPQISVGLHLSKSEGDREARWITMEKKDFELPPFNEITITNRIQFEKDLDAIAIIPEARFYAYTLNVGLIVDGNRKTLWRTQKWNPYWNGAFLLPAPVRVSAGSQIESYTIYENELHTLINEGKQPRVVHSGPAINEEVCRTHILVADVAGR